MKIPLGCICAAQSPRPAVSPPFSPQIFYNFGQIFSLWPFVWFSRNYRVKNHSVGHLVGFLAPLQRFSVSCLMLQFSESIMWSCGNVLLSLCQDRISSLALFVCTFQMYSSCQAAGLRPGWEEAPFTYWSQLSNFQCFSKPILTQIKWFISGSTGS